MTTDPVQQAIDSFIARYRRGEKPTVEEYIAQYPEHADELRELLPTLALMEDVGGEDPSSHGSNLTDAPVQPNLQHVGEYQIVKEVGRGGMGIVYEARQESLGRRVALKVLPVRAMNDKVLLERFRLEAKAAAGLNHPNIVPVFGAGHAEGIYYYAMQFIEGQTLRDILKEIKTRHGSAILQKPVVPSTAEASHAEASHTEATHESSAFSWITESTDRETPLETQVPYFRNIARIIQQVADALGYAHKQGILHRDIKPANLILDAQGTVWVTDFGLAKAEGEDELTFTGDILGTLPFMAPERFRGWSDPRSDIYSLGITLYHMATLKPAFTGVDKANLLKKITSEEPVRPRKIVSHLPRDLETIILKAIDKEPEHRYQTADQLAADLKAFLADRPIHARRISLPERSWRWCRRNRTMTALSALAAGFFLVAGAALMIAHWSDRAEKEAQYWRHLSQARALSWSGRPGRVFSSIKLLKKSIDLLPKLGLDEDALSQRMLTLRNEVIATTSRVDLALTRKIQLVQSPEDLLYSTRLTRPKSFGDILSPGKLARSVKPPNFERKFRPTPDFTRYAEGGYGGQVVIRRMDNQQAILTLPTQGIPVQQLRFSRCARFLAVFHEGRKNTVLQVWTIENEDSKEPQKPCLTITEPMQESAFDFHPDGRHLAVALLDGTIRFYRLDDRAMIGAIKLADPLASRRLRFHPEGRHLAVCFKRQVHIIDIQRGETILKLQHPEKVSGIDWHPHGEQLAVSAEDTNIYVWDALKGELAAKLEGHESEAMNLAYNHEGDLLASRSWDNTVRLWDPQAGRLLLTDYSKMYQGPIFSRDDTQMAYRLENLEAVSWSVALGRTCRTLYGHTKIFKGPTWVRIHPAGRILASLSCDGIRFWDLAQSRPLAHIPMFRKEHDTVFFYEKGDRFLTGSSQGFYEWPMGFDEDKDGLSIQVGPPVRLAPERLPKSGRFWPDKTGRHLLFNRGGRIGRFNLDTGTETVQQDWHEKMDHIVSSPDGRWIGTSTWSGEWVKVWEAGTGRLAATLPPKDSAQLCFSPDSRLLAVTGPKSSCIYTLPDCRVHYRRERNNRGNLPGAMAFSADGAMLAFTDSPSSIILMDPKTTFVFAHLQAPAPYIITSLCFTPDGGTLAVATHKYVVQVWDLRSIRKQLRNLSIDWDLAPYPAEDTAAKQHISMTIDLGVLGQPRRAAPVSHKLPNKHDTATQGMENITPGQDRQKALEKLNQAILRDPDNPEHYHRRGHHHEDSGELDKAAADFTAMLEKGGNPMTALSDRARVHIHRNDIEKAMADYRSLAEIQQGTPEEGSVKNAMAWLYMAGPAEACQPRKALPLAKRAVQLLPEDSDANNTLGIIYYRLEDYRKAVEALNRSVDLQKKAGTAFDYFFLAMSLEKLGQKKKAFECFEKAVAWCNAHSLTPNVVKMLAVFRKEAEAVLELSRNGPSGEGDGH